MYICFDIIIEYYDVYKVGILFNWSNELVEVVCIYLIIFKKYVDLLKKKCVGLFFKVEIIGDVYMVVFGLFLCNGNEYVIEIVKMLVVILDSVNDFYIWYLLDLKLCVRIGIYLGNMIFIVSIKVFGIYDFLIKCKLNCKRYIFYIGKYI